MVIQLSIVLQTFRPFIITKDMIQKKVFGAGYPSLPTLTIEEFYEQKVQDGTFQIPGSGGYVSMIELQDTREC